MAVVAYQLCDNDLCVGGCVSSSSVFCVVRVPVGCLRHLCLLGFRAVSVVCLAFIGGWSGCQ